MGYSEIIKRLRVQIQFLTVISTESTIESASDCKYFREKAQYGQMSRDMLKYLFEDKYVDRGKKFRGNRYQNSLKN